MDFAHFMGVLRTGRLFATRTGRGSSRRQPRRRLYLEPLEARVVPSTFTVVNTNDSGAGSLRQAVADARLDTPGIVDTITFDSSLSGQTIHLTSDDTYTGFGPTGLVIDNDLVTIDGSAAPGLVISGDNARRVFGVAATGILTLQGVTVSNGFTNGATGTGGGAVYVANGTTLNVFESLITGNAAGMTHKHGALKWYGGGIFSNGGVVNIIDSTISNNTVIGYGGGIANHNGALTVLNSTLTDNQALFLSGSINPTAGRQIYNVGDNINPARPRSPSGATAFASINNSILGQADTNAEDFTGTTIVGTKSVTYTIQTSDVDTAKNTISFSLPPGFKTGDAVTYSDGGGTGIGNLPNGTYYVVLEDSLGLTISLADTQADALATVPVVRILLSTGNNAQTLSGSVSLSPPAQNVTSGVANLIRTQSGFAGGIVSTADPLLQPLADNGGPTKTYLPGAGSPAIDSGDNSVASALSFDQRGLPRLLNSKIDLGAIETTPDSSTTTTTTDTTDTTSTGDSGPNTLVITDLEASAAQKPATKTQDTSVTYNYEVVVPRTPSATSAANSDSTESSSGSEGFEPPVTNAVEKSAATVAARGFDALEVDTVVADELDQVLRMQLGTYAVRYEHEVLSGVSIVRSLLTGTTPRTDLLAQGSDVTPVATLLLSTRANEPAGAEPVNTGSNPASFLMVPMPSDVLPVRAPDVSPDGPRSEMPAPTTRPATLVWTVSLLGAAVGFMHFAFRQVRTRVRPVAKPAEGRPASESRPG